MKETQLQRVASRRTIRTGSLTGTSASQRRLDKFMSDLRSRELNGQGKSLSMRHSITSISPIIENPTGKSSKKKRLANEAPPPTKRESWPGIQKQSTTKESRMCLTTCPPPKRTSRRLSASITAIEDECDDPEMWFDAIRQHDWEMVDQLIAWYDHAKYRPVPADLEPKKRTKKLRVLKYLPMLRKKKKDKEVKEVKETFNPPIRISPLLETDEKGRTPLHLACGELMPFSTLQSLFFLERNAVHVKDGYGRYPLHWAALAGHDEEVIDRLVRANPAALKVPDKLKRIPLAHAIWHIGHKRDTSHEGYKWRSPMRSEEAKWQTSQTEKWTAVSFLLDIYAKHNLGITKKCEMQLVIDAIEFQAPPRVVGVLLAMTAPVLPQAPAAIEKAVGFLLRHCYPLNLFELVCKACMGSPAQAHLQHIIARQGIMKHMQDGNEGLYREGSKTRTSFQDEMLELHKRQHVEGSLLLSRPCKEWWDKLKFFIGFCGTGSLKGHTLDERYLLHSSLAFPDTCVCLVKLLVGLFPRSLHIRDPETEHLPIHIACHRRYPSDTRDGSMSCQVLRLVLGGDTNLVNAQCLGRYPLHVALASDQHPSFLDILISLNPNVMTIRDPVTKLFPFQLAACGNHKTIKPGSKKPTPKYTETGHVDLVFRLLRCQPTVLDQLGAGTGAKSNKVPSKATTPSSNGAGIVAQHVTSFCYQQEGDEHVLNTKNVRLLRKAIANGEVPTSLQGWFRQLKLRIWKSYDQQNAGKMMVHLPREDRYLLHAALSIPSVPPIVVELILELFPKSVSTPVPGTDQYPIHLVAENKSMYKLRSFERPLSLGTPLELLVQALPASTRWVYKNQTPLQIATQAGKSGAALGPLTRGSRQRSVSGKI